MKNLVKDIITLNINELEAYDFPLNKVFGLEVISEGIKFCFIIRFSSINKNLICCAPVAHQRDSKNSSGQLIKPPYFDRWSWYKYFDESFIAFADPIFFYDETITVGWFVGDKNQWYLEVVSKIIKILSKKQNILQNNILFYSSSGGGFASVGLGTLIKGSKVIIDNSQLFIMNFHKGDIDNLFNILHKEFPDLTQTEIIEKINYRLNVIELFKKYEYIPPIHYYVNLESDEDLFHQCIPFIKEIKKLKSYNDNLTLFFYRDEKEKPHAPLPVDASVNILKSFSKNYLYNIEESEKNTLISNLDNTNSILNNQILELKEENKLLNNYVRVNKDTIIDQNLFNSKKQKLKQKEEDLFKKESLITKKQKLLTDKDKKIIEKENYLTLKNKQLVEKEKQLNDLLIKLKFTEYGFANNKKDIIFSEISDFWNIIVYDSATSNNHNDNSFVVPTGNHERTNEGSILSGNLGELFFTPTNDEYYHDCPIILELTAVEINDPSKMRFQVYSKKQKLNVTCSFDKLNIKKNDNVKLVYDGSILNIFVSDELKSSQNVTFTEKYRIGVQTFSDKAFFKYKNAKLYKFD